MLWKYQMWISHSEDEIIDKLRIEILQPLRNNS